MTTDERLPGFRPEIEGMRGVAILIVVLFHCSVPGFSGGFVGVDVFFVLSGFLITGLLVAEIQKTSELSLVRFYARRIRRLLPASALTLAITLLIGAMILAPHELDLAGHASRAAALNISNIFFDIHAGDYFAPNVKSNPILHTWSLAVEEQFYLFWPLLLLLTLGWCRSIKVLVIGISALTLVSLVISVWFSANGGTFAFYELPARAWEFGIGGLAVLLPRGIVNVSSGWWRSLGWLGIFAILGSAHLIVGANGFPGWVALIPVIGTAVVLVAETEHPNRGIGVVLNSASASDVRKALVFVVSLALALSCIFSRIGTEHYSCRQDCCGSCILGSCWNQLPLCGKPDSISSLSSKAPANVTLFRGSCHGVLARRRSFRHVVRDSAREGAKNAGNCCCNR